MSKSSTASGKIPTQLPSQSAWAKGPPQSSSSSAPSPRSQSPAPYNVASPVTATHSRRPSALGQGVPIKDGVTVPRNNVGSVRQGSAVTFGSIDDVAAPISSSPAATPAVKTESVKAFGSVQATAQNHVNGKTPAPAPAPGPSKQPSRPALSAASTSSSVATTSANSSSSTSTPSKTAMGKVDIAKLFQGSSSSSSQPPSDTSSPSTRPANLPSQQHHQPTQSSGHPPQSSQLGAHPYTPFVPGIRQQQQSGASPRSPAFPRAPLNGAGPPRPGGGPGGPMPASPRLAHAPHPHPGQPAGMPPQPVMQQWAPYYYPMDPYAQQPQYWGYMQPPPHMHQQPHPPHTPHPPPPGPQSPHPSMMSPRNHPPPLPGTPTMTPAVPNPPHTPHPPPSHSHQPSNSVSAISPPPTPSTANAPGGRSLNTNANAFVPGGRGGKVTIKSEDGTELNLEALKKTSPNPPTIPIPPPSPAAVPNRRTASVRIESEESKRKRLEETQRKEQEKKDAEERAKKEEEEKKRLEEEAKRKEEEEAERKKQEEEQERIRKEEEEKERIRHEEEEKERIRKEEEEARLEEERRQVAEKEAEERRQQEELEREEAQLEAEEANDTVEAPSPAEESAEPEDGEVVENGIATPEHLTNGDSESKLSKAKEALRIDTSSMPPPSELPRRRPGPLDLTSSKKDIPAGPQSALATARHIEDLSQIEYPQGIKSPSVELNANAKDKKFRYDREFLLQFMIICKEKPDHLPPLDVLGIEPVDQSSFAMARGGSGRHRQASGAMTPSSARQNSVGLGIVGGFGGKPGAGPGGFAMGQFSTPTSKLSSEERFAMSAPGVRSASMGSAAGMQFGRPPMTRTSSQGGPGGHAMGKRTRSKRGVDRNDGNKVPPPQQGQGSSFGGHGGQGAPAFGVQLEPVAPLEVSANRWVAGSTSRKPQADVDSPELVDRKVKALLNKLTMEKFDSISNQIIAWANKSEMEKDGRTLIQVIRLVFEKATDEAAWSEMYARLCRKMMEQISPEVQDDGIKNADGKPIAGGQLFRKYLLNRCQEDFERGWFAKEAAAAAAAAKASDDEATKAANEKKGADGEAELYSDEYYIAQKAKRQGLGLIKFIGELFKLQMLTERIMHECVKKLLGNVENPEEEEIESLCQLLKTVGQILDNPKARAHMDVYFTRMKELGKSTNVSSRMQFMLQDVIELRERKWVSRKEVAAPTTIAAVHEAAAKEKAVAEKESYQRQMSMSRGGSRRGGDRNQELGPDGWAVAGSVPRPPPKAGDLSNFGKINKAAPMTFGPSSVFAGKKDAAASKRESLSRTSSSQNMFSMLSQNPELAAEASGKPSRSGSRKSSVDFGQTGLPEAPPTRRKLQLLPRSKPAEESTPAASEDEPDSAADGSAAPAAMSEADAKKRVDEDVKEFFAVRNLEEADVYFTNLTPEHRFRLIDKLVGSALESKEADARLVGDFFSQVVGKAQVDADTFEEGFMPMAELLDDIAIDAPKAFDYMAIMLRGAGFDKDEERLGRITGKSMDSDKLLQLVTSP